MADDRDSARTGKAIELLVAATCILASDSQLGVSVNLVDDEGVDLIFHGRGDPTTLAVQVKGRLLTAKTIQNKQRFRAMSNRERSVRVPDSRCCSQSPTLKQGQ